MLPMESIGGTHVVLTAFSRVEPCGSKTYAANSKPLSRQTHEIYLHGLLHDGTGAQNQADKSKKDGKKVHNINPGGHQSTSNIKPKPIAFFHAEIVRPTAAMFATNGFIRVSEREAPSVGRLRQWRRPGFGRSLAVICQVSPKKLALRPI